MSMLDTLFNIFKGANPNASDEDIKSHIESMKASPEQMSSALGSLSPDSGTVKTSDMLLQSYGGKPKTEEPAPATPPAPAEPQGDISMSGTPDFSLKFPDANSIKSNYDVNISDDTVKMNGRPDSLPSHSPSTSPLPQEPEPMSPPAQPTPPVSDQAAPASKASGKAAKDSTDELKTIVSDDKKPDSEDAMLARERKKHNLGVIPVAAAGIGDAISNAASAFGAQGTSGTQGKVAEGINTSIDKDKAAFEAHQRKDPTSDVSRHYQKVLGLMLGDHAKTMDVSHMSAEHIAATLPEVEKYMQKELGLKQIQSNKELQMSMHEQGRQDKLEKDTREWVDNLSKARNGEIGVQNGKVDQARHLLQVYKQAEDTGKAISNSQYGELAIGAASLVAGGAQNVSDHTKQMIMQSTAKGDLNRALTYAGLDPSTLGGSTDAVLQNLKHLIIRQGLEAETQRNKFIEDQKATAPSGLNKEQSDRILGRQYGNSVKDFIKQPTSKAPPKASAPEGTTKKIGSRQFVVMNGIWHEIGQ